MPQYQVWYKGNPEPFVFASIGRLSDRQIVAKVLEKERIVPFLISDKNVGDAGEGEPPLGEIIQRNGLAPLKYTMDESEMFVIS